jgi:hypothetical protein
MPRCRKESSWRLSGFFTNPSANHLSLNSERRTLLAGPVASKHALLSYQADLRLITALVEETAKGIRKLKRILVPRRNENGCSISTSS